MANVEWASVFFQKVTSRLPDLLTEKGEGHELEALDQLRSELGEADKLAKGERAKALQAELDVLNGKAPVVTSVAPDAPAPLTNTSAALPPPAEEPKPEAKAAKPGNR